MPNHDDYHDTAQYDDTSYRDIDDLKADNLRAELDDIRAGFEERAADNFSNHSPYNDLRALVRTYLHTLDDLADALEQRRAGEPFDPAVFQRATVAKDLLRAAVDGE